MKTFFSKFVNRQHEQIFLDLIGNYCSSFDLSSHYTKVYRLRIFITKRRHIGQIYVENIVAKSGKVLKRRYLTSMWWDAYLTPGVHFMERRLVSLREQISAAKIDTSFIDAQIRVCNEIDDYVFRKRSYH